MIKAILIDDEEKARLTLVNYINNYCPDMIVIAEANSVETGISVIEEYKPDVVFLDILLTDGSGFILLNKLENITFKIIFVTSYNQYAIKAFKYSAFDYLLKPIDVDELIDLVNRLKTIGNSSETHVQLNYFNDVVKKAENDVKKIILATHNNIDIVNIDDIIYCEAKGNYCMFYFVNHTNLLVSKTLKEYEELLDKHYFFRAHKSYLVNLNFISKYTSIGGDQLILKSGISIPVSTRKKEALLKLIASIGLK